MVERHPTDGVGAAVARFIGLLPAFVLAGLCLRVAELGAGNQPLDIVSFQQGGAEHLLVSHTAHPLMKIACADIDRQEALTEPKEPAGVPRTLPDLAGVSLMANLDDDHILAVQDDESGARCMDRTAPESK